MTVLSSWGVPSVPELLSNFKEILNAEDAAARSFVAIRDGIFTDPEGRTDELRGIVNPLRQIALACWFAQKCETPLSVEVGFGMGSTASFILSARRTASESYRHVVLDPFGLTNDAGTVTQQFLDREFGANFDRQFRSSTFGLSTLFAEQGANSADFILIDGDHRFDGALADFQIAASLLNIGGFMILDDAAYPAVETLVHFIETNRPDFEVSWLEIPNTAVLRKIDHDRRAALHFVPFEVPRRTDWTCHPSGVQNPPEDWESLES